MIHSSLLSSLLVQRPCAAGASFLLDSVNCVNLFRTSAADMNKLTHLDEQGQARMVDVGGKAETRRVAIASGRIRMSADALAAIREGDAPKGDVLAAARIAGIMAAKKTSDLIPLCHPLALAKITVDIDPDTSLPGLRVKAFVRVDGTTGVEMEALTAVAVACLTIYDMAKAADRGMEIGDIRLEEKTGGRSGDFRAARSE
jgi:cyclic pyranopterin phosphate synthase